MFMESEKLMTFKEVTEELNKFQKELDEKELPLSELQKWAGSINYCFIILIEEIHTNFEKLGVLEEVEELNNKPEEEDGRFYT